MWGREVRPGNASFPDNCIKDNLCFEACPTDSIHPKKDEANFGHQSADIR